MASANEGRGGAPPRIGDMDDFVMALTNAGLSEVLFDWLEFIWTNKCVWQRHDRVAMNADWNMDFSFVHGTHLARGRSEHSSLLVKSSNGSRVKGLSNFLMGG